MAPFQLGSRARDLLGERVSMCQSHDVFPSEARTVFHGFPAALSSENASRFVILRMAGFSTLCSTPDEERDRFQFLWEVSAAVPTERHP